MQEVKYAEVYYQEYCDVLTKNFRSYFEKDLYIDLIFICKFNRRVGAHQLVLGSFSALLHKLFSDHQNYFKGHVAYVCVPDIKARSMSHLLKFVYYGKVALKTKAELLCLYEDLELLDLPNHVVTSESEPFCSYISGIRNLKTDNQKATEVSEMAGNSNSEHNGSANMEGVGEGMVLLLSDNRAYVNSSETEQASSSSLPIISSVSNMEPNTFPANANEENDVDETVSSVQELPSNTNPEHEMQSVADVPDDGEPVQTCTSTSDIANMNHVQPTSTKDNSNLMRVLKNVATACQDLETVGVSDDENIRRHLQSCVRIVKHCIADINELLSTEIISSSSGRSYTTFSQKDWELKIMLENCLEKLPKLERIIENSSGRSRRRRRRENRGIYLLHECGQGRGCE